MFGNGKSSVRGGFGMSYERNFGNVTFNTIQNVPNYAVLQIFGTPVTNSNVGPLGTAGPPVPLPPTELRNVNQNINVAQTQFWSLALQHQLARSSFVELAYSGAHGVHLYDVTAGNPIGGDAGLSRSRRRLPRHNHRCASRGPTLNMRRSMSAAAAARARTIR